MPRTFAPHARPSRASALALTRRPARGFSLIFGLGALIACGGGAANSTVATLPNQPKEGFELGSIEMGNHTAPVTTQVSETDLAIPIRHDDPIRGNRNAYVTMVVFTDFQCPYCAKHAANIELLAKNYRPDELRVVFKHQPLAFHENAAFAAEVAVGVMELGGRDAFWRYHHIAFERRGTLSEANAVTWAAETGVDERALAAGLASHKWRAKVEEDLAVGKAAGVTGTPCSFVNGVVVHGAQGIDHLTEVVDAELARAKSLEQRGVAREAIYGRMFATNFNAEKEVPKPAPEPEPEDLTTFAVPIGSAPTRGPATALVTIVEFSDYQCPFCGRVAPSLERIRKEYGDKVRLVWKDMPLPFHKRAMPAANFARSARAQKGVAGFWRAHDKIFETQSKLEDADLEKLARTLGLDVNVTMKAVRDDAYKAQIALDMKEGEAVKANGTPHFFINGRRFVGAQPFESFKKVIDEEIVRAEGLLKSGVSRGALYGELTKDGARGQTAPSVKRAKP